MRRSSCFSSIAMTLLMTIAACSSDDTTPAGPTGTGGSGGTAAGGTAGSGGTSTGTGGGGTTGSGGAPDGSADVSGDHAVNALFSFFVTSTGSTDGGNLGGLSGADQKCQTLATAVGAGSKTWHAYLSLSSAGPDGGAVNARDRIGAGPWYNVDGALIATNLGSLHEENDAGVNGITAATGLDEQGNRVPIGGDSGGTVQHDILTGSLPDGRAFPAAPDFTCAGWTSNRAGPPPAVPSDAASDGNDAAIEAAAEAAVDAALGDAAGTADVLRAFVGHVNRTGTNAPPANASWNSSHATPGCAQADLVRVGGAGRVYCFAVAP
jgi:hypothetical protein